MEALLAQFGRAPKSGETLTFNLCAAAISKICNIMFYKQHLHRNCIVLIHAWKLLGQIICYKRSP